MSEIHNIVTKSGGAYTHDEVFMLDAGFVKHLNLMIYEQDAFQNRLAAQRRQQNEIQKK